MVSAIPPIHTPLDHSIGHSLRAARGRGEISGRLGHTPREKRMMAPGPSISMSIFFAAARELSRVDMPSIAIPCNSLTRDFNSIHPHTHT